MTYPASSGEIRFASRSRRSRAPSTMRSAVGLPAPVGAAVLWSEPMRGPALATTASPSAGQAQQFDLRSVPRDMANAPLSKAETRINLAGFSHAIVANVSELGMHSAEAVRRVQAGVGPKIPCLLTAPGELRPPSSIVHRGRYDAAGFSAAPARQRLVRDRPQTVRAVHRPHCAA